MTANVRVELGSSVLWSSGSAVDIAVVSLISSAGMCVTEDDEVHSFVRIIDVLCLGLFEMSPIKRSGYRLYKGIWDLDVVKFLPFSMSVGCS